MATWFRAHNRNDITYVFSGDGGLYANGRWNHLGRRAIYCSQSIALCTLEWLAHNGLSVSGFSYYRFSIEIPDGMIARFTAAELPTDWNAVPASDAGRSFADAQLFTANGPLAIAIPSVVVPEEENLVINPLHFGFKNALGTVRALGIHEAPER